MSNDEEMKEKLQNLTAKVEDLRREKNVNLQQQLGDFSSSVQSLAAGKEQCRPRRHLKGHFGKVYALQWGKNDSVNSNAESNMILSASQDGKLIIWNGMNSLKADAIMLRSSWVMTCDFEPKEGRLVACGGLDNICSVYEPNYFKGPQPKAIELSIHDGYISCCRFINKNHIITSSGDSTCALWDVARHELLVEYKDHDADVMSLSICPTDEDNIFVSGSCDTTCKVWDKRVTTTSSKKWSKTAVLTFGSLTLNGEQANQSDVNSVCFLPNGKSFISGSDDSTIRLFDIRCCSQLAKYYEPRILSSVTSVCSSKSGRLIFGGYDDHACHVWDTLRCSESLPSSERNVYSFSPTFFPNAHDNRVSCVGMNASGQAIATGSWDTMIKIWG
eukprot:g5663.t1